MGRKKLPQEVLNLRGTARKDRERPTVSTGKELAEIQMWTVVGYSQLSDRARGIYRRVARACNALKILTVVDLPQLVIYAREYDWLLTAFEMEAKVGVMYSKKDKDGNVTWLQNPARGTIDSCIRNLNKIGGNFGLSPVDRQKIKVQGADEKPGDKIKRIFASIEYESDEGVDEQ